jgi:hypothetical protein
MNAARSSTEMTLFPRVGANHRGRPPADLHPKARLADSKNGQELREDFGR